MVLAIRYHSHIGNPGLEGRLQARVRHPGVITIYGADRIDGRVGLWMEIIEGRTLEQELDADGPFKATEAAKIGIELCRALGAVHEEGLLHRDVKAQNVMRDEKGRLVLGDFGTGRGAVDRDGREADSAHDVAGTPLYFAPEIFRREPGTAQSDLYSLGVLLYHLVTGSFPVRGCSVRQLRDSHDLGFGSSAGRGAPRAAGPVPPDRRPSARPPCGRSSCTARDTRCIVSCRILAWKEVRPGLDRHFRPPFAQNRFSRPARSAVGQKLASLPELLFLTKASPNL